MKQELTPDELKAFKRSDLIIDGSTSTYDLKIEGEIKGTYSGTFKFRCYLSPTQQIAANREFREILGPNPSFASNHVSLLAYALTELKYRIIQAPPFWVSESNSGYGGDIADENVVSTVLDAAMDSQLKYKVLLRQKGLSSVSKAKSSIEELMKEPEDTEEEQEINEED
jgi:hypothetical protein